MEDIDKLLQEPPTLKTVCDLQGGLTRGQNVGLFPKHHYIHVDYSKPDFELPLQVEFAGTDEAVTGVYRHTTGRDGSALKQFFDRDLTLYRIANVLPVTI